MSFSPLYSLPAGLRNHCYDRPSAFLVDFIYIDMYNTFFNPGSLDLLHGKLDSVHLLLISVKFYIFTFWTICSKLNMFFFLQ